MSLSGAAEEEDREDAELEFAGAAAGEPGRPKNKYSKVRRNERENNVIVYSKVLYLWVMLFTES